MLAIIYALATLRCLTGPDVSTVTNGENLSAFCQAYDLDGDHRVDLFDYAEIQIQAGCIFESCWLSPIGLCR